MIEKEYKEILDIQLYNQINNLFNWTSITNQINYYYMDKDKTLFLNNIHVRVRKIAEQCKLQIKYPCIDTENSECGLHIRNEQEKNINSVPEIISGDDIYEITHFRCRDAMKIGSLKTERKIYRPNGFIEICLDKSCYENRTDYEIEVEYTCGDADCELLEIKGFLSDIGITFEKKVKGKFTRFFERYLENNRE